jgi:hypothetical protein
MTAFATTDPIRLAGLASARPEDGGPPLDPEAAAPIPGKITFDELLRGLNPLHHLPVVGTIYRAVTGETIAPPLRVLGALAFGGVPGALLTAVLAAVEETRPMERLARAASGLPDPDLPPPDAAARARALAAYGESRDAAA